MARDRLPRRARRASVTLVALCVSTAIGIALGSYIALCTRSMQLSARQAQREKANELAQAGLEEALWALNQDTWTTSGPDGATSWTTAGVNRTATLSYPMTGQGMTGQVAITVANYASTGPTWPTVTVNATVTLAAGESFTNSVQATTQPAPLFGNAIASAESYVSFVAGGTVDSWNSDPDNNPATAMVPYSFTAGNATNYNAVVAGCTNGSTFGVQLMQAKVCGYVATTGMPVSYSTSGSPPGKILGPTTAAGVDVDTTRIGKSAFVPLSSIFSVTVPNLNVTTYNLIQLVLNLLGGILGLPAGSDTCKISGDLKIDPHPILNPNPNITIDKPIKLVVDGDFTVMGSGQFTITSTGSLQLFVNGNVSIGGNGILNQTNDPKKCAIFCTGSSTTTAVQYASTQNFCGVIFSENNPIDIQQNATFYGALLSRQYVRFSGSATAPVFHYDLALRQTRFSSVTTPYVLAQVTKL